MFPRTNVARPGLRTVALAATIVTGLSPGAPARAQEPGRPPALQAAPMQTAQLQLDRQVFVFDPAGAAMPGSGSAVVRGAPYCAEAVQETVQWLPDPQGAAGNRITRQVSTLLCRDGEGRTRQESESAGRKVVYLHDPVAGESWLLDTQRKTARRLGDRRGAGFAANEAAWSDWAREVADRARQAAGSFGTHPLPPPPAVLPAPAAAPVVVAAGEPQQRTEVRVLRLGAGDAPELPVPAAVQWRAQTLAPRGAGTVTPLPSREVDGLRANGVRTNWVIDAGKVGNEKPIQITREAWTSPDLTVTLSSRDFDPRSGEVNYRLKNLKRGEPDAALMRVPADFTRPARPAQRASGPTG